MPVQCRLGGVPLDQAIKIIACQWDFTFEEVVELARLESKLCSPGQFMSFSGEK